jgi:hypothetical protein
MAGANGWPDRVVAFRPTEADVADLIRRAETCAGGVEFLLHGAQDAVAAAFEVHAFVVDAARQKLAAGMKVR